MKPPPKNEDREIIMDALEYYDYECYEPKICDIAEEIGINGIAVILARWAADAGGLVLVHSVVASVTEAEVKEYLDYCGEEELEGDHEEPT